VHTGLVNVGPNERFRPSRLQRLLLRGLRFADAVITVSDAATRGLAPYAPRATFVRLDNAVDVASFDPAEPGAEPPTILFVGTLARRKGVPELVEAMVGLREAGVDGWRLELVGSGNEAGEEEARSVSEVVARSGLGRSLLGPLQGPALRERLRSAQLFVLPSHSEGQPIGILEAMASSLPVVATRVGGIPDVVTDGVEGLLVDPGRPEQLAEALRRLIEAPALRERMGEAGRRRVAEDFDLATLRRELAAVYRTASRRRQAFGDSRPRGGESRRPRSG
jgi:glycosyltransferase involved in cell wall biosynthesis